MKLQRILGNRNWERVFILYDEDGYAFHDPTEREAREDVKKYVTMDGETYEFVRVRHSWYRRIWFDLRSYLMIAKVDAE